MLRITLPFVFGAAISLFALPAVADSYDNHSYDNHESQYRSPDHAWYGDNDFSRCPSHRPLDVFRDGDGGFQAWRLPRRVCGWGHEPEGSRYGGSVTPHG
jgi:hypothetical protein